MTPPSFASFRSILACSACVAASLLAGPASAHSILVNPPPISPDDSAKSGPCGCYFGAGPQDPNDDPSPSACPGSYTITTLQAGTQLEIQWKETINHDGAFRVAFSSKAPDATTKADMDANVMSEITDENSTAGATLSTTVTLPNEPCELCTIQLRQYMMGAAQPYYYSCAAVKIVADSGTGGGGAGGAGGAGGNPGSGGTNAGGSGTGAMGQGGNFSTGAGKAEEPPAVDSSCSIRSPASDERSSPTPPALAIAALALASILRRGRR